MRAVIIAIAFFGISAAPAGAGNLELPTWYNKAEALVHSLLGEPPPDREIITPPPGIDPQMAVLPSGPPGEMPIIRPPGRLEQQ
jgi:hypothetical protein